LNGVAAAREGLWILVREAIAAVRDAALDVLDMTDLVVRQDRALALVLAGRATLDRSK
jgi:hypothetical protein